MKEKYCSSELNIIQANFPFVTKHKNYIFTVAFILLCLDIFQYAVIFFFTNTPQLKMTTVLL